MGAASSIKPVAVAPLEIIDAAASLPSRSRLYETSAGGTLNEDLDTSSPTVAEPYVRGRNEPRDKSSLEEARNTEITSTRKADTARAAERTPVDAAPAGAELETDHEPGGPGIATTLSASSAPLTMAAGEVSRKLRLINAAAVNGDKSSLVKLLDGDLRLLLIQNEFGR